MIPNGLNTHRYRPVSDSRPSDFDHPNDRRIILFGGAAATENPRKGYDLLVEAVNGLAAQSEYMLVLFGNHRPDIGNVDVETRAVGYLDPEELIRLYSLADVMAVPSRFESFGQTATEAMACGTPVIAFTGTGVADIVTHKETGYLASPYSTSEFCEGLGWLTESQNRIERLSEKARERAVNKYDIGEVCEKHMKLYERITP